MQKDEIRDQLVKLVKRALIAWEHGDVCERVADHLVAHGVTIQRWIPVSERLPKEGQSVLVYRESKKMIAPHVSLCTYHGTREKNEWSRRTDHVMYWMPLPEAPKGVE